jgi:hypothetical protein
MKMHVTDMVQFVGCRQRWYFGSPHGLNQTAILTPEALFTGRLFHEAVEVWNRCISTGQVSEEQATAAGLDVLAETAEKIFNRRGFSGQMAQKPWMEETYAKQLDLATEMFKAFCLWAPGKYEPLLGQVEQPFMLRIPTPGSGRPSYGLVEGKPDALVKYKGSTWILEVKTARTNWGHTPNLDIDLQMGAYLWALNRLRNDRPRVKGVLRLVATKRVPREPALTKLGKLSRAKITTTYELVMAAIIRHGLNPEDYRDWLDALADAPHPIFQLMPFYRSPVELRNVQERLYTIYRQMRDGHIYPNEGPLCKWCMFKDPCKYVQQGHDYEWVLEEEFIENDYRTTDAESADR